MKLKTVLTNLDYIKLEIYGNRPNNPKLKAQIFLILYEWKLMFKWNDP